MDYVVNKAWAAHVLFGAGIVAFHRPDRILKLGVTLARWGATPAAGYAASAVRYPDEPAIIDELGTLSFKDVHERTNRARQRAGRRRHQRGRQRRRAVPQPPLLHRARRGAAPSSGRTGCYLNTSFAGPQITDVMKREQATALVYDEEFAELVAEGGRRRKRFIGWFEGDGKPKDPLLEDLIVERRRRRRSTRRRSRAAR